MNNVSLALDAAWRVLLAGLVLGAGMPALFALGVRALAFADGTHTGRAPALARTMGRVAAVACFGVAVAAVVLGLTYLVASSTGKTLSLEHVFPTIVSK
ncbi:MAG: hypothetical protein ACOYBY_06410 [Dermatophilaceae bacterium]